MEPLKNPVTACVFIVLPPKTGIDGFSACNGWHTDNKKAGAKPGPFSHSANKAGALFKNRIEVQPFPVEYPTQFFECFNLYLPHPFPGQTDFFPDVFQS